MASSFTVGDESNQWWCGVTYQQHAELHNGADPLLLHGGACRPYQGLPLCAWQPGLDLLPYLFLSTLQVCPVSGV